MVPDTERAGGLAPDAEISLREVTKETARAITRLKVAPHQERFVASNAISMAEAYFEREKAWFRAIYAEETPVGFVMLYDDPEKPIYFLWRFMIDQHCQGRGYGRKALSLIVDHVRSRPNATEVLVSYVPGEGSPGAFYHRFGFVDTGEVDDGELVSRYTLDSEGAGEAP